MVVFMKWILIVLVVCSVVLISGCVDDNSEQKECEAQGGKWDYVGLSPEKICNLPTADGGAECNSSVDCEGDCIADLSEEEMELAWNGTEVRASGLCTHRKLVTGCLPFVEDGAVMLICMD